MRKPLTRNKSKTGRVNWRDRFGRCIIVAPVVFLFSSFLAGIIFWGGFNTALEVTNTETFCISCHEMKDYVYQEYKNTIHYQNRTGVRATCPDCHVPNAWTHKVIRKIGASNELYHKLIGSIDTPEKFEAKRWELAQVVWRSMKKTNSRECRNCHSFTSMKPALQRDVSWQRHQRALDEGKTCIDCNKGIAHKLPEAFVEIEHQRYKQEGVLCYQCHADMARPPDGDTWK